MRQKLVVAIAVVALFGSGIVVGMNVNSDAATARAKDPSIRYLKSIDNKLGATYDDESVVGMLDNSTTYLKDIEERLGHTFEDDSIAGMLYEMNFATVGSCRAAGGAAGYCGDKPIDRRKRDD